MPTLISKCQISNGAIGLPVMVGLFLFLPSKISLKNQTSLQEKKFAAGVKKSKEIVENWN